MDHEKELGKITTGEAVNPQQPYRSLIPFILTQEELSMQDIPPRDYLLSEWMPKDSFSMVYAPRGVGKSWFCMALAVAVSEGKKRFLGWDLHGQHDVLYVDGEMAKIDLKERFEGLCATPNPRLHILASEMLYREGRPLSLDFLEEQRAVDDALQYLEEKGCRAQLIIFDNLSTLRRSISENDNDAAKQLIDWFVNLRHRGYAVIVVHHAGKSGQQRGASILEVPMDCTIKLLEKDRNNTAKNQEARFDLKLEKIRAKRPLNDEFSVSLRPNEQGTLNLYFDVTESNIEPRYRVLKYLAQKGRETYRVMGGDLEMATGSIGGHLSNLLSEELIEGARQSPTVTVFGRSLLHDYWPDEFAEPNELELVQANDCPF
jgi:KaiC/GvpD/RAD55 family RecA-like ATPase